MNNLDHTLTCLIEEANELSAELLDIAQSCNALVKTCTKAMRFGLGDGNPFIDIKNKDDIMIEFIDISIKIEELVENGFLNKIPDEEFRKLKQLKKEKYEKYKKIHNQIDLDQQAMDMQKLLENK